MRKYTSLFVLGLFVIIFTASCSDQNNTNKLNIDTETTRAAQGEAMQVNFRGQMITIEAGDMVGTAKAMNSEDADAEAVMNINSTLMGAEKEAQLLDVNFTMSDEPVENGMFIFGIETEDAKNLTLEMHDEEGFAMVANNKFEVTEGNNYKALNVKSLEPGAYNFRLKDDMGKELNRVVQVAETK
ncbi:MULTISPECIES: hypothetical protein [unclassified Aureispira]|uniref:hypothetical protein n=1 Tax=unclassified Aureispira TaxID=2649989 RepID=UPI000697F1DA|nr:MULTISPECIES: hypothetical protein [unclassified Aureispira]WMX15225.1 hypothetical protein QP953_02425 [Aureispira sp. CCB-E]